MTYMQTSHVMNTAYAHAPRNERSIDITYTQRVTYACINTDPREADVHAHAHAHAPTRCARVCA